MSYYHKPRPNPLEHRRLFEYLEGHATKTPDKEVMVFYDAVQKRSSLTFNELNNQCRQLAKGLLRAGLERGDKVLICAPNCFAFAVSWLAVNLIGACAILTCPEDLSESREHLLKTTLKCEGFIGVLNVSPEQKSCVLKVLAGMTQMEKSSGRPVLKSVIIASDSNTTGISHDNIYLYDDLMAQEYPEEDLEKAQSKVQCEDLCFALLSTGTTGQTKAVCYTHHAIVNAINLDVPGGYEQDSVTFSGWPMSWGSEAPAFLAAVVIGFTFVTTPFSKITPNDSYDFMLKIIQDEKCDDLCIPQHDVLWMIKDKFHEKYDLSCVESLGYGGQIVPRKILSSLIDIFPEKCAVLVYGSVEVLMVAIQPLHKGNVNSDDYGKMYILPDIEVKVVDANDHVVPYGEKGLIHVRGAKVFQEYINQRELTATVKSKTGWVNTGDYGIMFDGGKLQVLGRESDMIHCGNEILFPVEFEDIIMQHHDIADIVVVGVPDKTFQEVICACIIEVPGSDLKSRKSELDDWCKEKFKSMAVGPKYFLFMDKLILVENSKIDRRAIQNFARKELDL